MIPLFVAWVYRRVLIGRAQECEIQALPEPFRRVARRLARQHEDERPIALQGFLASLEGGDESIGLISSIDPDSPPPEDQAARFATVADVRRTLSETRWVWGSWIPSSRIVGIGAFEGTGKTRLALDLCRRTYLGLPWPDGQPPTLPVGVRSIWLCADAHQDELAEMLPTFGVPDDAIVFPTPPEEPYGGTDLDSPETIQALEGAIIATRPTLVFIDTLTSATSRDLCDQRTMKPLKAPLARLAQTYGVSVILQLHLSREGQALGRRIRGVTRTLIHLECPEPEHPERLRLWVEKSYAKKPPALGVTMGDGGNEYDSTPPRPAEPNKGGRPPGQREKARQFIIENLTQENDRKATELSELWVKAGGSESTFWNARDSMVEAGELVCDGKPKLMHLIRQDRGAGEQP